MKKPKYEYVTKKQIAKALSGGIIGFITTKPVYYDPLNKNPKKVHRHRYDRVAHLGGIPISGSEKCKCGKRKP